MNDNKTKPKRSPAMKIIFYFLGTVLTAFIGTIVNFYFHDTTNQAYSPYQTKMLDHFEKLNSHLVKLNDNFESIDQKTRLQKEKREVYDELQMLPGMEPVKKSPPTSEKSDQPYLPPPVKTEQNGEYSSKYREHIAFSNSARVVKKGKWPVTRNIYSWVVYLKHNENLDLDDIEYVKYTLHKTFDPNEIVVDYPGTVKDKAFPIKRSGWGVFNISIYIRFTDESSFTTNYMLKFGRS